MTYRENLKSYLKNIEGNLEGEYTDDFSSSSDAFGEIMYLAASHKHYEQLLSIILFHQITIELMKRLIIYTNFLEKLCLYPNKKNHEKISTDESFSRVLRVFKLSLEFKNKKKLISDFKKINLLRNKYAHEIAFNHNIYAFEELQEFKAYNSFESIFTSFQEALEDLRNRIQIAKNKPSIQKLMS